MGTTGSLGMTANWARPLGDSPGDPLGEPRAETYLPKGFQFSTQINKNPWKSVRYVRYVRYMRYVRCVRCVRFGVE